MRPKEKWVDVGASVSSRLLKRGRDLFPDVVNRVSLWVLRDMTVRGMGMRKRKEKRRERRDSLGALMG